MTNPAYIVGTVQASDVPRQVINQGQTFGWLSAGEQGGVDVLSAANGRWRCGVSTATMAADGYAYSALYVVNGLEGVFGDGSDPALTYAAIYCPLLAPVGTAGQDNAPAVSHATLHRSGFWTYPMVTIPPGAFVDGARLYVEIPLKVKITNVAARSDAEVNFYFTIDPAGSELVIDNRQNEVQVGRESPAIHGWTPARPYIEGTISDVNGKILITLNDHVLASDDIVHITSVVDGDNVNLPPDLEEGVPLYVALSDVDSDVTDDANTFTLSYTPSSVGFDPVLNNYDSDPAELQTLLVAVSKSSSGSMHGITWKFTFTATEETDFDDYQYGKLELWGFADGRTAQTQEGVIWTAQMTLYPMAMSARNGAANHIEAVDMSTALVSNGASVGMTTPGNSMTTSGSDEAMTAAPLYRVKTTYYTDSTPTNIHAYQPALWDYGGNYDKVHLEERPHNEIIYTGGAITFSGATWNASARTIQKAAAFTSYSFRIGDKVRITGGTGWTAGYYEVEAKEANNRIRLVAGQAGMAASNNTDTAGDIDDYPLVAVLSEEVSGQNYNPAIQTLVVRDGETIGEVVWYSNIRQLLHVRTWNDVHVRRGDALELHVHRREKDGGSGSWSFNCNTTTPIRTIPVTAGTVEIGPHPTYLQGRIACDGPSNSDCVFEARGVVATLTHRNTPQ